jgi:hypothetical protein
MRSLGEFLKNQPKNVGAKGSIVTGSMRTPLKDTTPTLASAGISKKESSVSQAVADLASTNEHVYAESVAGRSTVAGAVGKVWKIGLDFCLHAFWLNAALDA